jgi:hypothetical protein
LSIDVDPAAGFSNFPPDFNPDSFQGSPGPTMPHMGWALDFQPPAMGLATRAWHSFTDWLASVGRAILSKDFLRNFLALAFRDALAAFGYSLGMRAIQAVASVGDLTFHAKQGLPDFGPSKAGKAFTPNAQNTQSWTSQRRYGNTGSMEGFTSSPSGVGSFSG